MADELLQMFQSITTSDHDELVDQFAYLLQLDHGTATFFLESCNWNVEVAVNNYLATMEAQDLAPGGRARHGAGGGDGALYGGAGDSRVATDDLDMEDGDGAQQVPIAAHALFVSDLAPSQSAVFPPGAIINMVWSFVNPGEHPWPEQTSLVFAQGESFGGPQQIQVAAAPQERIDVHAALRMPAAAGSFAGSWRLRSPHGFFGDPVWVILNVGAAQADAFPQDPSKLAFQHAGQPTPGFASGGAGSGGGGASTVVGGAGASNDIEDMDL